MINDLLNKWHFSDILLLFLLCAYIFMRIIQRKHQKQKWRNNFEFWLVYNLHDYFKNLWYPNPWERAERELQQIKENVKQECNTPQKSLH